MLPESELTRIEKKYEIPDLVSDKDFHIRNILSSKILSAKAEALIWYERMGKFTEWVGRRYTYCQSMSDFFWVERGDKAMLSRYTTPELITEFLNQLNEGK